MRPRDLARFGWLYLNKGVWNGSQVISNAWIDDSIREQASIAGRAPDGDGYGYRWFPRDYEHDGKTIPASIRTGWGGQALVLVGGCRVGRQAPAAVINAGAGKATLP